LAVPHEMMRLDDHLMLPREMLLDRSGMKKKV
jgi:hypothetical protein